MLGFKSPGAAFGLPRAVWCLPELLSGWRWRRRQGGVDEIGFVHSAADESDFAVFKFTHGNISLVMVLISGFDAAFWRCREDFTRGHGAM